MYYYLNYFFIFSIIGHLIESLLVLIFDWNFKSGYLYGYWTPVYGLGVVLIILMSHLIFRKLKVNKVLEIIIFFISISLLLSFMEWVGGNVLYLIFNKDFWLYNNHKYHLGKYISLEMTLVWGVTSILFLYLIKPWMDKIIVKIPKFITIIFIFLFIIDNIFTILNKH